MNDPLILREKLREVLAMVPNRRFSEQMILDALNKLMPEPVDSAQLAKTINWNHGKGYIESRYNEDYERHEWGLTDAGKQKEKL